MRKRRGLSLIELTVILSGCTVIIASTTTLIERVMRVHTKSRQYVAVERDASRLANQFRADVRAARSASENTTAVDKGSFLKLELPNGRTIDYSRDGEVVRRVETGAGKPEWREEFGCSAGDQLTINREENPARLTLLIVRPSIEEAVAKDPMAVVHGPPPMHLRAEALIGRDQRFAAPAQGATP